MNNTVAILLDCVFCLSVILNVYLLWREVLALKRTVAQMQVDLEVKQALQAYREWGDAVVPSTDEVAQTATPGKHAAGAPLMSSIANIRALSEIADVPKQAPVPVHLFQGRSDRWCEVCNLPDRHDVHRIKEHDNA